MVKIDDLTSDKDATIAASDGTIMRKGTILTLLRNIEMLNHMIEHTDDNIKAIKSFSRDVGELMPTLHATGLFSLFSPEEWLTPTSPLNQARILTGMIYLEYYPHLCTPPRKTLIRTHMKHYHPLLQQRAEALTR